MQNTKWYDAVNHRQPCRTSHPRGLRRITTAQVCCFARLLERTGRAGDGFDDIRDLEWDGEADGEFEGL